MLKRFGLVALSFCFMAFGCKAVTPSLGLIVPYEVICETQSDGTNQIRFRVLLKKHASEPTVNGATLTGITYPTLSILVPSVSILADTFLLQSKASCSDLDTIYDATHKLFGFDAIKVGDVQGKGAGQQGEFAVSFPELDICAYLVNLRTCCTKDVRDAVKDFVVLGDTEEVQWVDVGTLTGFGTISSVLSNGVYANDAVLKAQMFHVTLPNNSQGDLSILLKILETAVLNLHGQPCCFESFGLKAEDAKGVLLQIISHLMNGKDGSFTAAGTFGSCGDTGAVTVTGNRTFQKRVNVCGDSLCLIELPSVVSTGDPIANLITSPVTGQSSRCFTQFLGDYINKGFATGLTFVPPFGTFGLQDELCRLLDGRDSVNDVIKYTDKLNLLCLGDDTYGFVVTQKTGDDAIGTRLKVLGCRFKLEKCKPCCK